MITRPNSIREQMIKFSNTFTTDTIHSSPFCNRCRLFINNILAHYASTLHIDIYLWTKQQQQNYRRKVIAMLGKSKKKIIQTLPYTLNRFKSVRPRKILNNINHYILSSICVFFDVSCSHFSTKYIKIVLFFYRHWVKFSICVSVRFEDSHLYWNGTNNVYFIPMDPSENKHELCTMS